MSQLRLRPLRRPLILPTTPTPRRLPFRSSSSLSQPKHPTKSANTSTTTSIPSSQSPPPDHRTLAVKQGLFTSSPYSPGSPLFLPHGATIFNRLVDFLRKQYVYYGFEEVITPTIYKKGLWERSGHWDNYADDMYAVNSRKKPDDAASSLTSGCLHEHEYEYEHGQDPTDPTDADADDYGLKPMNCPGHCLLFSSTARSYRDLPLRLADFSPLHRNEISGALSGLTRVRRFHQDDGHIFCRPAQVESEISRTLEFVRVVYSILDIGVGYRLALSTRPDKFIGKVAEWERAEGALRRALENSGLPWTVNSGDGAFYGPKIDIILRDSDGKEHQTATVQLDFQLPKRFNLEYTAPAPSHESRGETTNNPALLATTGPVTPVMIHRAVLGSVERLMALLIEHTNGKWPFWLNPRQVVLTTVKDTPAVLSFAQRVHDVVEGHDHEARKAVARGEKTAAAHFRAPTGLRVEVDSRAVSVGKKVKEAREAGYGLVVVIGEKNVESGLVSVSGQSLPRVEGEEGEGKKQKSVDLTPEELRDLMIELSATFQ